jgi:hypothetical protein
VFCENFGLQSSKFLTFNFLLFIRICVTPYINTQILLRKNNSTFEMNLNSLSVNPRPAQAQISTKWVTLPLADVYRSACLHWLAANTGPTVQWCGRACGNANELPNRVGKFFPIVNCQNVSYEYSSCVYLVYVIISGIYKINNIFYTFMQLGGYLKNYVAFSIARFENNLDTHSYKTFLNTLAVVEHQNCNQFSDIIYINLY